MTPQEIQERNKQIALMLGWKETTLEYKLKWRGVPTEERLKRLNQDYVPILMKENEDPLFNSSLRWHSNWNWLMEAVEFIYGTLGFRKYSYSNEEHSRCLFTDMAIISQNHNYGGGNIITDSGKQSTEKEAVFIAVSDFAKLYNQNKL